MSAPVGGCDTVEAACAEILLQYDASVCDNQSKQRVLPEYWIVTVVGLT